jgi:DNA-binding MarR family transcriptional regulator
MGDLYRKFQIAAAARYAGLGWKGLTLAHVQFLAEVEESGTRLTEIAASLGTTKQYVGKLAREAAERGLVELLKDPSDRRAVRVVPIRKGRTFLADACAVRRELESEFLARLGPDRSRVFLKALEDLGRRSPSGRA